MLTREIDAAQLADIAKFEVQLGRYLAGDLEEDVFRVFRLNNGIYGQRQGGHNQMVRTKIPYGGLAPDQLDAMADISETYSRGWGHLTTRQNVQFHFVQLERVPDLLRDLAAVGLTTREACGDTVRNVMGCHLAGACPLEELDITPWAEAAFRHFLRHPLAQRLPRKFKINFSGCNTDCGQAMFNDVGVIAVSRTADDGSVERGFRVFVAGGLGANPHPALALEEFTSREDLHAHPRGRPARLLQPRQPRQQAAGPPQVAGRHHGLGRAPGPHPQGAQVPARVVTWPGGIPEAVMKAGDEPAGRAGTVSAIGQGVDGVGVPVALRGRSDYDRWEAANVVRGEAKGTVSAIAYARLGDVTAAQFRGLAAIQRSLGLDVRVTNRQNFALRGLREEQLPLLFDQLRALDMAQPGAELSRDVVACPGADTCNLAVTQSRGLADAIGDALDEAGLAEVGGIRTNISGCTNSCGQHHIADIGFFGAERRAHGRSAPGYQLMLGGYVGEERIHFGEKALRLPAKSAADAAVRIVGRFNEEREAGEAFRSWIDRSGGAKGVAATLEDLAEFPDPDEHPEFYVDYDETGPYEAVTGDSECAT